MATTTGLSWPSCAVVCCWLVAAALGRGAAAAAAAAAPPSLVAALDYGTFRGAYSEAYNISYWQKIPYAAPPVGENRFRAPQPPVRLPEGAVYDSSRVFDMCPQRTVGSVCPRPCLPPCLFVCLLLRGDACVPIPSWALSVAWRCVWTCLPTNLRYTRI